MQVRAVMGRRAKILWGEHGSTGLSSCVSAMLLLGELVADFAFLKALAFSLLSWGLYLSQFQRQHWHILLGVVSSFCES